MFEPSLTLLTDIILSDPAGLALPHESTCGSFTVTDGPGAGCTDDGACNYDSDFED